MTDSSMPARDFARLLARRSMNMVRALALAAGDGVHHLSVTQPIPDGRIAEADCLIVGPAVPEESDGPDDPVAKVAYLLGTTAFGGSAMLIAQTLNEQGEVRFMSWMVHDLIAYPATADQSVIAYCISADRDLTDPVSGVTFVDAPSLA
ncbi:hypothetical protein [Streptomyces lavendulae]|nr:hypothetical protein [Streptomyces lavendulae]